jgi:hypothetical protein
MRNIIKKKKCLLFKHEKNNQTLSNDWPTITVYRLGLVHISVYRLGLVHITSSSRFTIMTSNLFPVSPSLYFGRKLGLFLKAKYNKTNSSRHFRPGSFPEMTCNKLMNIDRKACNNILEAFDKLTLSTRLGHSCETGWNKHNSSYYSKQNSKFYHRVKF